MKMMASSSQQKPPSDPPRQADQGEFSDEGTSIRARTPSSSPPRRVRHQSGVRPGLERNALEHKLSLAKALLESLPPTHPRARLLRIAIVRRDETVLDGILSDLSLKPR